MAQGAASRVVLRPGPPSAQAHDNSEVTGMRVCVFGGASPTIGTDLVEFGRRTGRVFAAHGLGVVFGGGSRGMMGAVADGALAAGGEVIGVIPRFLFDREPPHPGVADLRVVDSMHERKQVMYALAHGFVAVAGGFGTMEEVMEVLTWRQLGLHQKPIIFLDGAGRWLPLEQLFDHMVRDGFLTASNRAIVGFAGQPEQALEALRAAGEATEAPADAGLAQLS
jgi:hypothetical protein